MTLQPFDLLAAEWVGLVGVPLLALGVGTTLLARYERRSTDDRSITP
jgi:hypothetical protein